MRKNKIIALNLLAGAIVLLVTMFFMQENELHPSSSKEAMNMGLFFSFFFLSFGGLSSLGIFYLFDQITKSDRSALLKITFLHTFFTYGGGTFLIIGLLSFDRNQGLLKNIMLYLTTSIFGIPISLVFGFIPTCLMFGFNYYLFSKARY